MSDVKPREFWIEDRKESDKPIERPYKKYVASNLFGGVVGDEDYPDAEIIHVIEKSAYDKLKVENESLKKQIEELKEYKFMYEYVRGVM